MGNKSRSELTLLLLLIAALCLEAFIIERRVYAPAEKMNWTDARQYCQKNHIDLFTWNLVHGFKLTDFLVNNKIKQAWIGLIRDSQYASVWRWITPKIEERISGDDVCYSFNANTNTMQSNVCSRKLNFICYDDNLVVVNENKTWEDALTHCRSMETPCEDDLRPCIYRHDLLSLEHWTDHNNFIRDRIQRATTDEVWTGLRFLGGEWWWLNGQQLEVGNLPDCPSLWEHCGTLSKYDTNNWITRNCSERRNFICYRYKHLNCV